MFRGVFLFLGILLSPTFLTFLFLFILYFFNFFLALFDFGTKFKS